MQIVLNRLNLQNAERFVRELITFFANKDTETDQIAKAIVDGVTKHFTPAGVAFGPAQMAIVLEAFSQYMEEEQKLAFERAIREAIDRLNAPVAFPRPDPVVTTPRDPRRPGRRPQ
jgi:hypothetical protein